MAPWPECSTARLLHATQTQVLLLLHAMHSDLTEATLAGAWISMAAAVLMVLLFGMVSNRASS